MAKYLTFPVRVTLSFLFIALFLGFGTWLGWDLEQIQELLKARPILAPALYVLIHIASTVVAPFVSLPLIPFAASAWGVLLTSFLNLIGWWVGAMIAFEVSRVLGRTALLYLFSLERLDRWIDRLSRRQAFWSIVMARIIFPVEMASYALGLIKTIPFQTHAGATFLGLIPFSVLWSIFGKALMDSNWSVLIIFVGIGAGLALVVWLIWRWRR